MPLRPLSTDKDYTFPAGTYDVRDWEVRTRVDNEKVGKIDDVLVDETGSPRYLDVDLGLFKKHVLVAIGQAEVDPERDVVWVSGITSERFEDIPEYEHDLAKLDNAYESRVIEAYSAAYPEDRYYDRPDYEADWLRRHKQPAAPANLGTTHGRLRPLRELDDYEVADDDPDPRGWRVETADGQKVGEVEELIADAGEMKVRYLDVELDSSELGLEGADRHVLVPVGYTRLDDDQDRVILDAIQTKDLVTLPTHSRDMDRELEKIVHEQYIAGLTAETRYHHPAYQADRFYAPRSEGP